MQRWLIVFLSIFFLTACNMPETRIYSLHLPTESNKTADLKADDASLVIIVSSARYLTQPYIAYRNSPYELEISRYSRWDSSPNEILREVFKDAISKAGIFKEVRASSSVPDGFYALKINLKRFERFDDGDNSFGEILFDVILISPDGKEIYQKTISKKARLDERNFRGLARGLSSALSEGVEDVRSGIYSHFSAETAK
ncbi:MAG: hypothetical protein OHK0032_13700 [Thermodesulfovibrionales bacterium]